MKFYIRLTPVEFPGVIEHPPTYEFVETETFDGKGVGPEGVEWIACPDGSGDSYLGPLYTKPDREKMIEAGCQWELLGTSPETTKLFIARIVDALLEAM